MRLARFLIILLTMLAVPVLAAPASAVAEAQKSARSRIGLVLSGGGGRGLAHLGVLKVLEELHVPVDCISGTSMGGIIGGIYASGAPLDEMEQRVQAIDWQDAFRDRPDRQDMRIRQKITEESGYLAHPEFGFNNWQFQAPAGILYGQKIEKLFADLARRGDGIDDFSKLPIPFKTVATDIASGQEYVLDHGALWQAMRATMSLPGVMAPVELNGKKLLDGGLVNNLPVNLARQMCADKIIAVNLGSPLLKHEEIQSMFGVSEQMIQILTEQNVQAALATLRSGDILISPELDGIRTSSFDQVDLTVLRGEQAARKMAHALRALSLSEAEYADWLQKRLRQAQSGQTIDAIRFSQLNYVNPETLLRSFRFKPGKTSREDIEASAKELYMRGDFQRVGSHYLDENGQRVAVIDAEEKSWGPGYLRFGVNASADLLGNTQYNLIARHNRTWVNRYGGEWRNQAQLGYATAAVSEFYQPLGLNGPFFVSPRLVFTRSSSALYIGDDEITKLTFRTFRGVLDVGAEFGRIGEVRVGAVRGHLSGESVVGIPVEKTRFELGGWLSRINYDVLDSVDYPGAGSAGQLEYYSSRPKMGAGQQYDRLEFNWIGATTWYNNTIQIALRAGKPITDNPLPIYDAFNLGGFNQMSGYPYERFRSQEFEYNRISIYRNIPPLLALNIGGLIEKFQAGASFEMARIRRSFDSQTPDSKYYSGSLFVGARTMLGPVYLSYGRSGDGNNTLWLTLGRSWTPR